ncbi:MAG TPA: HD domain-containing protein [Acidimicrobiia bacterium]|jgi:putative hydrolase of HD superfamily
MTTDGDTFDELHKLATEATNTDIADRIRFVAELDRLRLVERRSYVARGVRRENTAEHSWHVATMALVLQPLLGGIDVDKVVHMMLVHDIVEIDAGDVPVYDYEARAAKQVEEVAAADRIYGLLPDAAGGAFRAWWDEYEAGTTPEAQAAKALDRLAPLLLNWMAQGRSWRELGVHASEVRAVNLPVAEQVSSELAALVRALIDNAVAHGWLPE